MRGFLRTPPHRASNPNKLQSLKSLSCASSTNRRNLRRNSCTECFPLPPDIGGPGPSVFNRSSRPRGGPTHRTVSPVVDHLLLPPQPSAGVSDGAAISSVERGPDSREGNQSPAETLIPKRFFRKSSQLPHQFVKINIAYVLGALYPVDAPRPREP